MLGLFNRRKYDHIGFLVEQMRVLHNELISLNVEFFSGNISQEDYHKLSEAKTRLLLKRRRQHKYATIT